MNTRIMHLRSMNPFWKKGNGENKFCNNKRGITVYAEIEEDDEKDGLQVTFSWAIQNPKDQYNKSYGVELARFRFEENSIVTINSDYYPDYPLKYQFFNAVALAREHVNHPDSQVSAEDAAFLDLTFGTLCQIAYDNLWFYNADPALIPKIHPDIMINFVSRMYTAQFSRKCSFKTKYIDPVLALMTEKTNNYAV